MKPSACSCRHCRWSISCRASCRRRRPAPRAAGRRWTRRLRRRRPEIPPDTVTCGGTMSGNCATGICSSASAPAIVMTKAMTIARRGTIDEDGGNHGRGARRAWSPIAPPSFCVRPSSAVAFMLDWISALAGPGETGWPGRTFCRPSTITLSPSECRWLRRRWSRSIARAGSGAARPCCRRRRHRHIRPADPTARRNAGSPAPRPAARPPG